MQTRIKNLLALEKQLFFRGFILFYDSGESVERADGSRGDGEPVWIGDNRSQK